MKRMLLFMNKQKYFPLLCSMRSFSLSSNLYSQRVKNESQIFCSRRSFQPKEHHTYEAFISHPFFQFEKHFSSSVSYKPDSLRTRIRRKLTDAFSNNSKANMAGCFVYEKCADNVDYNEFFTYFRLPDTFQSWFLAVQLHVWMCLVAGAPERNGRVFRNSVVSSMWNDVELRLDKLAEMRSSKKKEYLSGMRDQFQAALISYDEGILADDTVLAAAAWRTLFNFKYVDPFILENIVIYVRRQVSHLEALNTEELVLRGSISFLPLSSVVQNR